MGYRDGDRVLYVAIYNDKAETLDVTSDLYDSWSGLWQSANDCFEAKLVADPDLARFLWQDVLHVGGKPSSYGVVAS